MKIQDNLQEALEVVRQATPIYAAVPGLVWLTEIPTIIIPDLHGRRQFLHDLMNKVVRGKSVENHMIDGNVNVVFLGDAMHSEHRGKNRWRQASRPEINQALNNEMHESVCLLGMLAELKLKSRSHFWHIRGNHDHITGEFYKYAPMGESLLAQMWAAKNNCTNVIRQYENELPLIIFCGDTAYSHSLPRNPINIDKIRSKHIDEFMNISWTDNTLAYPRESMMKLWTYHRRRYWVIGHRPVFTGAYSPGNRPRYRMQDNNRVIQINAPDAYMIGFKRPGKKPNVFCLSRTNKGKDLENL